VEFVIPNDDQIDRVRLGAARPRTKTQALQRFKSADWLVLPPDMEHLNESPMLFFRGDARPPSSCFQEGFKPPQMIAERPVLMGRAGGDILVGSAVCLSKTLKSAAVFPLTNGKTVPSKSYLYFLAIRKYFDTQEIQTDLAFTRAGAPILSGAGKEKLRKLLAANEVAVMKVEPEAVIGAVEITRQMLGDDWTQGVRVSVVPGMFRRNPRARLEHSEDVVKHIIEMLPTMFDAAKPETDEDLRRSGFR
jgi:hypothetical protein